ncbi:hypothetical protein IAT38_000904 [Cryptococcus sp. DSM 104549]
MDFAVTTNYRLRYGIKESVPTFITATARPPPNLGQLVADHPTLMYRHVLKPPMNAFLGWMSWGFKGSEPARQLCFFEAFRLEDGSVLTRRDLVKAWGCAANGARFCNILLATIDDWEEDYEMPIRFEKEVEGLRVLHAEANEISYAMAHLSLWEKRLYTPTSWLPPGPYDLGDLTDTAPCRLFGRPGEDDTPAPLTSLFIHAARHALALQHRGFGKEWYDLWRMLKPDPDWAYWDLLPDDCGVEVQEVTPHEERGEGTQDGGVLEGSS